MPVTPPHRRVYALASHGLFSGNASANIEKSCLEEVVVLNTVPANAKIACVSTNH